MTDRHVLDGVVPGAFVALADTRADDFTLADHLHAMTLQCAQALNAPAAGVLITDEHGQLRVAAGSIEATRLLAALQVRAGSGPALECFRAGAPILVPDITQGATRWPQFASWATQLGLCSVYAVPLRLRGNVLGSLMMFGHGVGDPHASTLRLAQALADVATVGLLQSRAIVDAAFTLLRGTARSGNHRLDDVAADFIAGTATPSIPEPAATATTARPTDRTT